jgi:N-acetylmuramoyl-L-alanine amidase
MMKKNTCHILSLQRNPIGVLVYSIVIIFLFTQKLQADEPDKNKIHTVVVDPGHGGKDPGTVGKQTKEKEIVLGIALKLGKYIEDNMSDVKVIYTRKTDVFVPLHERAEIANKNDADIFISIHANADPKWKAEGTETYAMGLHKSEDNLEVAKLENSVILMEEDYTTNYENFDPNSAESYIAISLLQNIHLEQSLEFASYIQNQFRERAKRKDRGVKQAGFLVLWQTTMPSVLVERFP